MTREEAYYWRIKLLCGYDKKYDHWLDTYLETEEPLSDIVLTLLDCHNINDVLRCLNLYCLEKPFDEESVYRRLRLELREQYENASITQDCLLSELYRISQIIPDCQFQNRCLTLSDYYELVELGFADKNEFDAILRKWLFEGGTIDTHHLFGTQI